LRKKPLECVLSVYTNSENAITERQVGFVVNCVPVRTVSWSSNEPGLDISHMLRAPSFPFFSAERVG
jgi:hypothetical protein